MIFPVTRLDHQIERQGAARAEKNGRLRVLQARAIRCDQQVRLQPLALFSADLPQAGGAPFLTHLDQELCIEAEAAARLGLAITPLRATDPPSLAAAIETMAQSRPDALLVGGDPLFNPAEFIERATSFRVPVFHYWPGTAQRGALVSYAADIHDNFRRAAGYVDRILKGAKPAELPIYQPTRYKLVLNAKIAQALGLVFPPELLQRADEVIR